MQNPTYEDMIMLSSLLGPAKPPVASEADVSSAGGLLRLVEYGGSLVAEALEGNERIRIADGERCLVCLSDYEAAEELRQLVKCKHLFHKDCIDQVRRCISPWSSKRSDLTLEPVASHGPKFLSPVPRARCQGNFQCRTTNRADGRAHRLDLRGNNPPEDASSIGSSPRL